MKKEVERFSKIKVRVRGSFEGGLVVFPLLGKVKVEQLVRGRVTVRKRTENRPSLLSHF